MSIRLNLVVVRTQDLEVLVRFYERLGLDFQQHRHGEGPRHYACELHGAVFEIYPLGKKQTSADTAVRLGFNLPAIDQKVAVVAETGGVVVREPSDSPWGYRAVVEDPDGRRIELVERT